MAVRRGKFRAFLKSDPDSIKYEEHSFTSSQDGEISVEIAVGPRGEIKNPDVEIAGGNDEPYIPGDPGLFVMWIKPGSKADRLLSPGCQITKIGDVDVRNVSRHVAENMLRFAEKSARIHVITRNLDEVSQASTKMVSWGTVSFDDDTSDSGRGTEVSEKEIKPNLDGGLKVNVKVAVGLRGQLLPLDFEIYGGQDERSIDGYTGIFIKKIKEGSPLHKTVKVGDHILKVNGCDVTNVPQHVFFNMLRATDRLAKIQVMKIPVKKDSREVRVFEDEETGVNEKIVEISTGPKGQLGKLGLKINGGRDRPCVPGDPGIFITAIKRGSVLEKVIGPGDKILKIDGANVSNVPLRFAFDKIKAADRRVRLHIRKADHTEHDNSERTRKRSAWRAARSFSTEQLEEYRVAFSVYDRTGQDRISLKHMMELCRQLGLNLTSIDKDVITTEFRLGGDSKISFMDFIQILTKITTSHQSDSDLKDAFEVFDREEKGFFRLHELEEALNEMPGSELMTESELADILQLADPDGDGHVSFEEFRGLILPLFNQY
ncbi:hypothetical protein ACROYT_G023920 [Oculina patagonica]